mmetsp:Transcript_66999/g.132097  ORF Transcript_66999/g.132097 Transcript_66999/m.132097 type:complete len:100 (+) Transcript_66999:27-326(+)
MKKKVKRVSQTKAVVKQATTVEVGATAGTIELAKATKAPTVKRKVLKRKKVQQPTDAKSQVDAVPAVAAAGTGECQLCDGLIATVAFKCRGCGKTMLPE